MVEHETLQVVMGVHHMVVSYVGMKFLLTGNTLSAFFSF